MNKPRKTMTESQMAWSIRKGYAWADPGNENCCWQHQTFWTKGGGYQWDASRQVWEMVF
jgi:hypothetical protein